MPQYYNASISLRWRQNGRDSVSNHQPGHCLLSLLFGRRSKKTSKLRVTGLCVGNSPGPVNSPHKGPVTRKMFPFDDVIMYFDEARVELVADIGYGTFLGTLSPTAFYTVIEIRWTFHYPLILIRLNRSARSFAHDTTDLLLSGQHQLAILSP